MNPGFVSASNTVFSNQVADARIDIAKATAISTRRRRWRGSGGFFLNVLPF